MDLAVRSHERGHSMSRYIATTILAIAAAVVTVAELATTVEHLGTAVAPWVVGP
jgi:Zn-dependent membrane protease YugP